MFETAVSLAVAYTAKLQTGGVGGDPEVAREIVSRLRQLHWLYARIQRLERSLIEEYEKTHGRLDPDQNVLLAYLDRGGPPDASVPFAPAEELRLMGEAFYHSAHRILVILDQCQDSLPRLPPIAANGVRRVRNNLLEHANKKGGHPSYTFSVSNVAGLRLRTVSRAEDPQAYLDEGIRANATEFLAELESVLGSSGRCSTESPYP